jgi:predicted transcriptional regulator
MKAKELIKDIINDLIDKNSKQYEEIKELKNSFCELQSENRKLKSEIKFRDNTINLK